LRTARADPFWKHGRLCRTHVDSRVALSTPNYTFRHISLRTFSKGHDTQHSMKARFFLFKKNLQKTPKRIRPMVAKEASTFFLVRENKLSKRFPCHVERLALLTRTRFREANAPRVHRTDCTIALAAGNILIAVEPFCHRLSETRSARESKISPPFTRSIRVSNLRLFLSGSAASGRIEHFKLLSHLGSVRGSNCEWSLSPKRAAASALHVVAIVQSIGRLLVRELESNDSVFKTRRCTRACVERFEAITCKEDVRVMA
jgi:hypothetical protein